MTGRITPERITELSMCEVFVFGSNLEGQHHGGAARMACDRFGAEWGVGVGPTGKCYAIPTMHGGIEDIKPYVDDFVKYVKRHPNNRFLVTPIGCGIAGFKDEEIAPLFKELKDTQMYVCLKNGFYCCMKMKRLKFSVLILFPKSLKLRFLKQLLRRT